MLTAAAGPVILHGSRLAHGMSTAVGSAIRNANRDAEQRAQRHYNARDEYLSKRRLASQTKYVKDHSAHTGVRTARADEAVRDDDHNPTQAFAKGSGHIRSGLLLRMAELRSSRDVNGGLDESTVERVFPDWYVNPNSYRTQEWNPNVVLHDLVLAVSNLAYAASIDNPLPHTLQSETKYTD